jgi:hypothetical protein
LLDLRGEKEERRAGDVRARPWLAPGERVEAVLDARPHERMPGRVELDLVDPVAEAVVGPQPRRMLVRLARPLERLAGEELSERRRLLGGPAGALALERLA